MVKLTARRPILYQGRMYEPGDPLPAHDGRMVSAWLDAKSAEWTGEKPATDTAENAAHAGTAESAGNGLEAAQESQDGKDTAQGAQEDQDGKDAAQGTQEGQDDDQDTVNMVEGHLDANDLEAMKKDDLERLADDMGVKLPRGATKALIVKLLAEEPVQAPASGGGAQ
ncbi:MAG: hypothetical protein MSB10_12995 [Clostridiales bacterium]|uniref:hypothetical protein n=1 Tax=Flavonifractor porci TaxID=3133422 RepID=UPI00309A67CE|nr:hypothetical protein [Clostridiales bacterium]